jgi:hypothetical protein
MAKRTLHASYRITAKNELRRMLVPFQSGEVLVAPGRNVVIFSLGLASRLYLDGDVYSAAVTLAPSPMPPFTGTRWVVQLNEDETWSFQNQGHNEELLAGANGIATLARVPINPAMAPLDTTRWLIYSDLGGFRFRPAMRDSGWLGVRDGRAVLSRPEDAPGRWLYWAIAPALEEWRQ